MIVLISSFKSKYLITTFVESPFGLTLTLASVSFASNAGDYGVVSLRDILTFASVLASLLPLVPVATISLPACTA